MYYLLQFLFAFYYSTEKNLEYLKIFVFISFIISELHVSKHNMSYNCNYCQ